VRFRDWWRSSSLLPLGLLFCVAISLLIFAVPPNMDEYLVYEPLACSTHPLARGMIGTACDWWKLTLFGYELRIRSYPYIGLSSSLFHAPLFFLIPHWVSARLLGLISLLLVLVGVQRLTRASYSTVLIVVGLCFPFAYQVLADTGPVGFHMVLFAWIPLLIREIDQAPGGASLRWRQIALGLGIFLGIEQKPFIAAFLPVIAAVGVALTFTDAQFSRKHVQLMKRLILPFALCAIPTALLLSAQTENGQSYLGYLLDFSQQTNPNIPSKFFRHIYQHLAHYLGNVARFADRNYPVETGGVYAYLAGTTTVFWAFYAGILAMSRSWSKPAPRILLIGCLGSIAVLALVRQTWRCHHAVFVFPFLLPALCIAVEQIKLMRVRNRLLGGLLCTQLLFFALIPFQSTREDASWSRLKVLSYLKASGLDCGNLIIHYDWGAYYLSALYGSTYQRAGFLRDFVTEPKLAEVLEFSTTTGADPVFVMRAEGNHDWALLRKYFPDLRIVFSATDESGGWQLWRGSPARLGF
jgi:hypothetical protein